MVIMSFIYDLLYFTKIYEEIMRNLLHFGGAAPEFTWYIFAIRNRTAYADFFQQFDSFIEKS